MNHHLDATDRAILRMLQKDGKTTNKEIAYWMKKTVTPVYDRRKRMEDLGIIKKYVAILDLEKITSCIVAFPHIALTNHGEDALENFQKTVFEFPEVMECYHITGEYDFMLKIIIPDMTAYNLFLRTKISVIPNVGSVQSSLVLSQSKSEIGIPFLE